MSDPKILKVSKTPGTAGQYALNVTVQYEGESPEMVTFVGSTYGGPIVMVTPAGTQTFVSREVCDRLGSTLTEGWVRKFLGPREEW